MRAELTNHHLAERILPIKISIKRADEKIMATGAVVQSDRYSAYLITSADVLTVSERLRISVPQHDEDLVAQVVASDTNLNLALLKVNGLNLPGLVFARSNSLEDSPVWSAVPWEVGKNLLGFAKGTLKPGLNAGGFLEHSAVVGSQYSGSVLLNSCGELLGYTSSPVLEGDQVAVGEGLIRDFLNHYGLRATKASSDCVSSNQVVQENASRAIEAAEQAKQAQLAANLQAKTLKLQIEQTEQRNSVLIAKSDNAQKVADEAIKSAEQAQSYANQTRTELERQTTLIASKIESETQAIVERIDLDRAAAEERFNTIIVSAHEAAAQREKVMWVAFAIALSVLVVFVVLLQRLTFSRSGSIKPKADVKPTANKPYEAAPMSREFVLDGRDEGGLRHMVSILDTDLEIVDGIVIGRSSTGSPFSINHVDVSRRHARIKLLEDQLFVEDLGSTNGTSVNGQSIDEKGLVRLSSGDQIIIGSVVMKLRVNEG